MSSFSLHTALDYDHGIRSYTATITVSDGVHSVAVPLSVSLLPQNEMAPLFPNNPTLTVPEDYSVGALLYTYTAADSDAAPHGVQEYQLVSGEYCFVFE